MSVLEEEIQASGCFGLLYDEGNGLCRKCEAWYQCEQVTKSVVDSLPETPPKWSKLLPEDYEMPSLGSYTDAEIEEMLDEHGVDLAEFDKHTGMSRRLYMMGRLKYYLAKEAADELRTMRQ